MNKVALLNPHKADPLPRIIIPFLPSYPNLFFLTKFSIISFSLQAKQLSLLIKKLSHGDIIPSSSTRFDTAHHEFTMFETEMGADWGPVIVAVALFILLSPGLLFQIPSRYRVVEFGNMNTSGIAILVHAVIFFCILTILVIAVGIHLHFT